MIRELKAWGLVGRMLLSGKSLDTIAYELEGETAKLKYRMGK